VSPDPQTSAGNVAAAIETVASHLHPPRSFALDDHPVPTGREEIWRFTPVKRLAGLFPGAPSPGQLSWKYDPPGGMTVTTVETEQVRAMGVPAPMDRLAAAAVTNSESAVLIDIAPEAELTEPVVFRLTGEPPVTDGQVSPEVVWGTIVLRVGRHARATVVFEHAGTAQYATSVSVLVADGAQLDLVNIQLWDDDAVHAGQISSRLGRDARLRSFQASLGGDLVRLSETVEYDGPGGEAELTGLYFASGGRDRTRGQHLEHRLFIDHNQPETRSQVDYRGALEGEGAHTVWVGDVLIRKQAEGIDTYESNRNLVLTDGCRADSVPNLEIETGEILGAGHASTTGRFDDEQLFYLRSRGIPYEEARRLVVLGFFDELLQRVPVPGLDERLGELIEARLAKGGAF